MPPALATTNLAADRAETPAPIRALPSIYGPLTCARYSQDVGRGTKEQGDDRLGLPLGFAAYFVWGGFPLYFSLLEPAGPVEVMAHRVFWSAIFCLLVLTVRRNWTEFKRIVTTPKLFWPLALAGALIAANWGFYVYTVLSGHVIDASLGYFINPLITVLLAVILLRERLRPMQWVALGIGASAVIVISVGYGQVPWLALILALTFGLYGYVKKRMGVSVPALEGLAIETGAIAPLALGYLIWLQVAGDAKFVGYGAWHALALVGAGVVTAIPLILFNAATRRLPLSVMGMLQYITPILQFIMGVCVFHEPMATARWIGFGLVWAALVVLSADGLMANRAEHRFRRIAAERG